MHWGQGTVSCSSSPGRVQRPLQESWRARRTLGKCFLRPKGLGFRLRQSLSCLAGKGEPPKIRPVVIWKIIAHFFHLPASILCASYLLFHEILTHLMKWVLLLWLLLLKPLVIHKNTEAYREVKNNNHNCPGVHSKRDGT